MKKILLLVSLVSIGTAWGYTHHIINTTASTVNVKVNLKWAPDKNITLDANQTKDVNVVGWCTNSIEAEAVSGPAAGLPRAVGKVDGCKSVTAYIKYQSPQGQNGQVVVNVGNNPAQAQGQFYVEIR